MRKFLAWLFIVSVASLAWAGSCVGTVCTPICSSSSCTTTEVQNTANLLLSGYTLNMPAGNLPAFGPVTIPNTAIGVTITGQGTCTGCGLTTGWYPSVPAYATPSGLTTTINGNGSQAFIYNPTSPGLTVIQNLILNGNFGSSGAFQIDGINGLPAGCPNGCLRVENLYITPSAIADKPFTINTVTAFNWPTDGIYGSMSHITELLPSGSPVPPVCSTGLALVYGANRSFFDDDFTGTKKALYIEDNRIRGVNCPLPLTTTVADVEYGGRIVYRNNVLDDMQLNTHDTGSTQYSFGTREREDYNNVFTCSRVADGTGNSNCGFSAIQVGRSGTYIGVGNVMPLCTNSCVNGPNGYQTPYATEVSRTDGSFNGVSDTWNFPPDTFQGNIAWGTPNPAVMCGDLMPHTSGGTNPIDVFNGNCPRRNGACPSGCTPANGFPNSCTAQAAGGTGFVDDNPQTGSAGQQGSCGNFFNIGGTPNTILSFLDGNGPNPSPAPATIVASPNGLSESGSTVTVTTTAAHGLNINDWVWVSGVGVAGYIPASNVFVQIATVPSSTTFTYTFSGIGTGLANSGNGTVSKGVYPAVNQLGFGKFVINPPPGKPHNLPSPAYWVNNKDSNNSNAPITTNNIAAADAPWIQADRDIYIHNSSFNGTTGGGAGLLNARPATCTAGVGYWATDTNVLYKCSALGASPAFASSPVYAASPVFASNPVFAATPVFAGDPWDRYYQPFTYPHPLNQ